MFIVEVMDQSEGLLADEPIAVTALFPLREVIEGEVLAMFAELLDDSVVRKAFFEHVVNALADGSGKASDLSGSTMFGMWLVNWLGWLVGGLFRFHKFSVAIFGRGSEVRITQNYSEW